MHHRQNMATGRELDDEKATLKDETKTYKISVRLYSNHNLRIKTFTYEGVTI